MNNQTMQWKDEFKIGIPVLDAQHKQLFTCNSDLEAALAGGMKQEFIDECLTQIGFYITRHFAMEEQYMELSSYPDLPVQHEAHHYFTKRFAEIQEEFRQKGLSPTIVHAIQNELNLWLTKHILGLDQTFGAYYREKGKKVSP